MKSWHIGVAVLLACVLLGFRVCAAERRVDRLRVRLAEGQDRAAPGPDGERPIAQLEAELARASEELALLAQRADAKIDLEELDTSVSVERILSVVTDEQQRILERNLEFHRKRWIEQREAALADFVERYGLSPQHHERIRALLVAEADAMAELLGSEQRREQPEQFVSEAASLLLETDRRVEAMLDDEPRARWQQLRFAERRMLWPWLPEPLSP